MATPFRRGRIVGARSLLLVQGLACVALGAALLMAPPVGLTGLALWLGLYWLVRAGATVVHTLVVEPRRWAGRGLVVILHIAAAFLVLQAPVFGGFSVGFSIVLFLGFQALVAGGIELVIADRSDAHSTAFLGLVNVVIGIGLVAEVLAGYRLLPGLLTWGVVCGGLLATYALLWLPTPRPGRRAWQLDRPSPPASEG